MRSTLVIGLLPTDIIIEFSDLEKTILLGSIDKNSNPNVLEITLINPTKFKTSNLKSNIEYPIAGLDFRNLTRRNDINLKFYD